MNEVVIRQWGDIWHVRSDDGSTTAGSFGDALMWATGDLEPGGGPVNIRWGQPIPEDDCP